MAAQHTATYNRNHLKETYMHIRTLEQDAQLSQRDRATRYVS